MSSLRNKTWYLASQKDIILFMYIIPLICYGIPLYDIDNFTARSDELSDWIEDSGCPGIHSFYHGGSDETPMFLGIKSSRLETLPWCKFPTVTPTQHQNALEEFERLWNMLTPTDQAILARCPNPQWFILETSS